jgi:hypothetical protein
MIGESIGLLLMDIVRLTHCKLGLQEQRGSGAPMRRAELAAETANRRGKPGGNTFEHVVARGGTCGCG